MEKPLVSVIMITYGQEKYITQAINGVFIQKTNFPVELIIANDCSPDNSDAVIKEVIKNAPENIRVNYIKHEKNMGMNPNFLFALKQAQGKYIAICEGDDYWIEPTKLQKQVDFLEKNPDYVICYHNFKVLNGDKLSDTSHFDNINIKDTSDIIDLSKNNIIPTLSSCYRNIKINLPVWISDAPLGDLVNFLHIAEFGKIKYFNEKWAVYRQNVGVWHILSKDYIKTVILYENLVQHFQHIPEVAYNLKKLYIINIKLYLKELSLPTVLSNKYFKVLSFTDKVKIIIRLIQIRVIQIIKR